MFHGSITALITPFLNDRIDEAAFEAIIEQQIAEGTHALVPAGTTGESPTLNHEEHNRVIERCIQVAAGRVPVIAGTGSNATHEAVSLTQHAQDAGADAALVVVPYYNKPTQEGLYRHFKAIHDATDIPIILYNVPGRTVVDMKDETTARLAELPRIIGIKDATGDLKRPAHLAGLVAKDFVQFSGNDDTVIEFIEAGGAGCISVTSNIAPGLCARMHNAWHGGDREKARAIQEKLMNLHDILFCETSPGPVKYAAHLMGLCREDVRLPLVPPSEEHKARIREVLQHMELVS